MAVIYEDGYEEKLTDADKRRNEAYAFASGDKVVPAKREALSQTLHDRHDSMMSAMAEACVSVLTVKDLHICDRGVEHTFEEISGRFNLSHLADPRGSESHYGVIAEIEDVLWLVPLEEDWQSGSYPKPTPMKLATKMGRAAEYQVGADVGELAWSCGDFVTSPNGDGTHEIVAVPWLAEASDEEKDAAISAIASVDDYDPFRF